MPLPAADALPLCPTRDHIRRRIGEIEAGAVEKPGASRLTTALEEERRRLYMDWNSTLSINRLPAEILLRLFAACFQPARPVSDELPKWTHRRRKVLLLVCRKWRDLIEATRTLWSFITPYMPPRLYTLVLSRAGEANLDISFERQPGSPASVDISLSPDLAPLSLPQDDIQRLNDTEDSEDDENSGESEGEGEGDEYSAGNLSSEPGPWIIEDGDSAFWSEAAGMAIAAESYRTSTLVLSDEEDDRCYSLPFLKMLFHDRAWPVLEELYVDFDAIKSPGPVSSILRLTRARFPRLQHLQLEGMVLPIEPKLFPRLRSLHLSGPVTQWPPLEDVLICLSSARYLEDLCLSLERGGWAQEVLREPHYPPPTSPVRLPLELPHLHSLSLHYNKGAWPTLEELFVDFDGIKTPGPVSSILCLTHTRFPRLQHLELEGMVLPIEPTMFPLFRSLRLSGPMMQWPPLEDLLVCLSSARYLETLTLDPERPAEMLRPPHNPPPTSPVRLPLELPHLRSLSLHSNKNDDMMMLLRAIPLIRPTTLDFLYLSNGDWRQVAPNESGRSLSILDAFFPTRAPDAMPMPIPPSVRKLYVLVPEFTGFSANDRDSGTLGGTRLFTWEAFPTPDDPDMYGLSNAIDDILTLFRHIPLTQLDLITLHSVHPADGRWDEIFGAFPALEYLYLCGEGTPIAFLRALTPSSDRSTAPCPALESLDYDATPASEEDVKATLEATVRCLRARAARGMRPLNALEVSISMNMLSERREDGVGSFAGAFLAQMRELVAGEVTFEYGPYTVT
ncbi:uncharacterized protein BXZ73DRAFT_99019 [Epithele typhae]|uniref:uncharacterized protein n=1 Tax=Epithele typhae TaxID=378194 RepID=UPI002007F42B|nr:uncharacterized protein BXZ73DRAFT_99019 [Epithele typhae]KAH9940024.1 hypothetical protein BXZ73DRAFT_99019 [Epithele typhae]